MTIKNTITTLALCFGILSAGCGPTFDPASLINSTRVVGARTEVQGAPDRATPRPGETVNVTWLVTSPNATPPLRWAFAVCAPETVGGKTALGCGTAPLFIFQGTANPPRISIPVPEAEALGTFRKLVLFGAICAGDDSTLNFDGASGTPTCAGIGGTTATVSIPLQLGAETNHNPTAEHSFTFDGKEWAPPVPAADPCVVGPRVLAGSEGHVIGNTTVGMDRETYAGMPNALLVPMPTRESLQISQFTDSGKLKSQYSFVEAVDESAKTVVDVNWDAPKAADIPANGLSVTFTFVVRDSRGGIDWTTRAACVGS